MGFRNYHHHYDYLIYSLYIAYGQLNAEAFEKKTLLKRELQESDNEKWEWQKNKNDVDYIIDCTDA